MNRGRRGRELARDGEGGRGGERRTRGEKIEKLNPSAGDWATGYVCRSVMVPGCDFLAHRVADCELEDEAGAEGVGGGGGGGGGGTRGEQQRRDAGCVDTLHVSRRLAARIRRRHP